MFRHYLLSVYGNLLKYRSAALINVSSLVLGMSACLLIMLYVVDELGYDRWIPEAERVFRFETEFVNAAGETRLIRKSALRARRDLLEYFPELETAARAIDQEVVVASDNEEFFETAWFVDREFPAILGLDFLAGSAETALNDIGSIVISETVAHKYFGTQLPLGRILRLDGQQDYQVSGVFANAPARSHISPDILLPYDENDALYGIGYSESWGSIEGYTYLKLKAGIDPAAISEQLPAFLDNYQAAALNSPASVRAHLINVLDIHLSQGGTGNIKEPGNRQMLLALCFIAFLVLALACINFVNLSAIRSTTRNNEVSVRKAMGASSRQLTLQFLFESLLISLLALAISVSLVELLLPYFNQLLGRKIEVAYFSGVVALIGLAGFFLLLGAASGFLPVARMPSLQPARLMKPLVHKAKAGAGSIQTILVTFQFAISIALIITTLVILAQQAFIESKPLGFSTADKLVIRNVGQGFVRDRQELLASELERLPGVTGTAYSVATPADTVGSIFTRPVTMAGRQDAEFQLYPKPVDADFFSVYDIALLAGRAFSDELLTDRFYWQGSAEQSNAPSSAVLNMAALRELGLESLEAALGSVLELNGTQLKVIGVVPDVHFQSLRSAITPNLYLYSPQDFIALTVSFTAGVNEEALLADITRVWNELSPGLPLTSEFVKDNVQGQYLQDRIQFLLITMFAGLAIAIACMGLYALAAWSTQRRTREIGIRKVHGALSIDIVRMLMLQFSKPVLLANLLAWPCALFAAFWYLEGFEYRIKVGPSLFILATVLATSIAGVAIVFHALSVAEEKPALALRNE